MHITVNPSRFGPGDPVRLSVSVAGDAITIEGDSYDFSSLAEGDEVAATATGCKFIGGDVVGRVAGVIHLTLNIPWGPNPALPPHPPIDVASGPVTLPEYDYDA